MGKSKNPEVLRDEMECADSYIGVPGLFHRALIVSPPTNDRQLSFSLSVMALSFFGSVVLVLTPTSAKGLASSFLTSDRSWGQLARHFSQYSDQK